MALHKGFDPSKQFVVTKGFYEGGRKYSEGDAYNPRTKIGRSKVLFRHFVAGRVEQVKDEPKVEQKAYQSAEPDKTADEESVSTTSSSSSQDDNQSSTSKKRGRRKKTTTSTDS